MLLFSFSACQKENIDEIVVEDPVYTPDTTTVNGVFGKMEAGSTDGATLECLTIQFPFEITTEGAGTVSVTTQAELADLLGGNSDQLVDFVYPLEVMDAEGNTASANNLEELGAYSASCVPTSGWTLGFSSGELLPAFIFDNVICYEVVYPVNLEDGEGNEYEANTESEFIDIWLSVDELYFVLPLTMQDIVTQDEITVATVNEFFDAVLGCDGIAPPVADSSIMIQGFGCNTLLFPFEVADPAGNISTVEDAEEYVDLLLSGQQILLQFPFSLENLDGDEVVINNIEDLIDALNACGGFYIEITTGDPCDVPAHVLVYLNQNTCGYVNFPAELAAGGQIFVLQSMNDYWPVYNDYQLNEIEIVYPVSVTDNDGNVITLEDEDDVCDFYNDCF